MDWYKAYKYSMALPSDWPEDESNLEKGIVKIDWIMREDVAKEEQLRNPTLKFLADGANGVVYDIGNGHVIKYSTDSREAEVAKLLMSNPNVYPTARIFDVRQIQTNPDIWAVEVEKVVPLTYEEARNNMQWWRNLKIKLQKELAPIGLHHDIGVGNLGRNENGDVVILDLGIETFH